MGRNLLQRQIEGRPGRAWPTDQSKRWCGLAIFACMLVASSAPAAEIMELEGNQTFFTANLIRPFEFGRGNISPAGDGDMWRHPGANAGDLVFAYADKTGSTTGSDTTLSVHADDGSLIEFDNNDGAGNSAAIAGAVIPLAGNVYFQVRENDDNDTITPYRLYQAVLNPIDSMTEVEFNGTLVSANVVTAPIVNGEIPFSSGDLDYFRFWAPAGARIVVLIDNSPGENVGGSALSIQLLDSGGLGLAISSTSAATNAGALGSYTVASEGIYYVKVSESGGTGSGTLFRLIVLVNGVVYADRDADDVPDSDDNCPSVYNPTQLDTDQDGAGDACDACPASPLKQVPGACGCFQPDVDVNGDGVIDCGLADPARSMLSGVGLVLIPEQDNDRVMAFDPFDGDLVDPNFIPDAGSNLMIPFTALLGPDQASIIVSDQLLDVVQQFDLDGNFIGTFAPSGGVNNTILDTANGMMYLPDGSLLVGSGALDTIPQFDSGGNFLGNFIGPAVGGLDGPFDMHLRGNQLLVADLDAEAVKIYDATTGTFISDFATFDARSNPEQLEELSDGHIFLANFAGNDRGIIEFDAAGVRLNQLLPPGLDGFRGLFALGNGNLLVTTRNLIVTSLAVDNGGVFEIDRAGNLVSAKITGLSARLIELALQDADGDGVGDAVDGCPQDAAKASPGQCGCANADIDGDGDGVADCVDACPGLDDSADANADGIPDCLAQLGLVPAGQPRGCCAPGVFPTVGFIAPGFLLGWRARRRHDRRFRTDAKCRRSRVVSVDRDVPVRQTPRVTDCVTRLQEEK